VGVQDVITPYVKAPWTSRCVLFAPGFDVLTPFEYFAFKQLNLRLEALLLNTSVRTRGALRVLKALVY
jgi:hypothetical protein